jgi:hypothetical protein
VFLGEINRGRSMCATRRCRLCIISEEFGMGVYVCARVCGIQNMNARQYNPLSLECYAYLYWHIFSRSWHRWYVVFLYTLNS